MKSGYDQFFKKARQAKAPRETSAAPSRTEAPASAGRDQLIEELRQRVIANRKAVKKKRKFPTRLVLSAVCLSFLCGLGWVFQDSITAGIEKIEVVAFGEAVAADPPKEAAKKPAAAEPAASQAKPRDWNDDEVNHFRKLVERKNALDAREAELARMEAELNAQRDEVEKRLKALEDTRRNISSVLQEKVAEDEKKIETLVQMYSSMKPVQAAKIIEAMDEDLAVQIIGRMKKKNAAEVMNLMNAEKAKTFSEKYAGYKKD